MTPTLTAENLFREQQVHLKLRWVAGRNGRERLLEPATAKYPGMALVGHVNLIHPNRVQVIGSAEAEYLDGLDADERRRIINNLAGCPTTAVIVLASDIAPPEDLLAAADASALAVFATPLASPVIIDHLQYFLTRALAPRLTVHGVYMEVMGTGVLITGESGIGKSEIALELMSRNHRLIADDAVEFIRVGPDVLVGQCPQTLSHYLEVRGLGILDVRMMFGETAVRHKKKLHLIVRLEQLAKEDMAKIDRLQAQQSMRAILDVPIPEVVLFVAPGRNLAVLVEAATRAHILRMWNIDPLDQFMKEHRAIIEKNHARIRESESNNETTDSPEQIEATKKERSANPR
jgi:HPr kinase/phosphorylase